VKKNGHKIKKYYFLNEAILTGGLGHRKICLKFTGGLGRRKIVQHLTLECNPKNKKISINSLFIH
jgi:hypothetical protein